VLCAITCYWQVLALQGWQVGSRHIINARSGPEALRTAECRPQVRRHVCHIRLGQKHPRTKPGLQADSPLQADFLPPVDGLSVKSCTDDHALAWLQFELKYPPI
jgi:hypothetical protein